MNCIHCGNYIPEGTSFCSNCGAPVEQPAAVPPPAPAAPPANNRNLLIALAALLALLVVGGGAYIIHSNNQEKEKAEQMAQAQAAQAQAQAQAAQQALEEQQRLEAQRQEEERAAAEQAETNRMTGSFRFTGTVAGQRVTMNLNVDGDGSAYGTYYYNKYSGRNKMTISGSYSHNGFYLDEYNPDGEYCGSWSGSVHGRSVSGSMTNFKGNTYSFSLSR